MNSTGLTASIMLGCTASVDMFENILRLYMTCLVFENKFDQNSMLYLNCCNTLKQLTVLKHSICDYKTSKYDKFMLKESRFNFTLAGDFGDFDICCWAR